MTTLSFDPMPALRAQATTQLIMEINRQASIYLHSDMTLLVAIARGVQIAHPVEARDARFHTIILAIDKAKSPEEIEAAMSGINDPYPPAPANHFAL